MNRWILFLLATSLVSSLAEVVVLNDSNFEHLTQASTGQTTGKWFVKFYASGCGHCKKLVPTWEELSNSFEEDQGIVVAKVDAVANRDTAKRFGVKSYPTLLYIADGRLYTYKGARQLEDMKEFVVTGYKQKDSLPVPPPPSFVETQRKKVKQVVESNKLLSMMLEDFEHIVSMRKNAAVVLLLLGAFVGFLVGYFVASAGKSKSSKSKTE
jgi:protein disulfide-isomerase-like protein